MGNRGLQKVYGLNLNVATMEPSLRYQAIQSGDIQITDAYSTDAEITRYDLVVLEDDKQLLPTLPRRTFNERGVVETTSGIRKVC